MATLLLDIGKNIKKLRKEKDIKGEALGKKLGVTKAAISQMESGEVDFKISTLEKIASFLGTSIPDLLEGDQCIESAFANYRFETERHLRTTNMLVCRIEYLDEQIKCMKKQNKYTKMKKVS